MLWQALDALDLGGPGGLQPHASHFIDAVTTVLSRFEDHATVNLRRYKRLQIPALIAAAAVPPLVALNLGLGSRIVAAALGSYVAAATAIEAFLAAGRRWRHSRANAELLKSEGWMYVALAGPYAAFHPSDHRGAFHDFADRVIGSWRGEIDQYVEIVTAAGRREAPPAAASQPEPDTR
jgi:hypothetical protein